MDKNGLLMPKARKISNIYKWNGPISLAILLFSLCEFFYCKASGQRSAYVLVIFLVISAVLNALRGIRLSWRDIALVVLAFAALIYTRNEESIRYALLLLNMMLWAKFSYKRLDVFIQLLVVFAALLSLIQMFMGMERIYGFSIGSPTQFACVMLVCELYLLVCVNNTGGSAWRLVCAALCVLVIFLTGTRSNFLIGAVAFAGYLCLMGINSLPVKYRKRTLIAVIILAVVLLVVLFPTLLAFIDRTMNRSNGQDSTLTRIMLYERLLKAWVRNPLVILFGNRGGFVQHMMQQQLNSSMYFPGHQDFLVLLCEYGLIGLTAVSVAILGKRRNWLYFVVAFFACSFHNIILNPMVMMLLVITMQDLDHRQFSTLVHQNQLSKLNFELPDWKSGVSLKEKIAQWKSETFASRAGVRILFLVNTSSQLLNAAVMAQTEFQGKPCDVYYTNNVSNEAQQLVKAGVLSKAYAITLVEDPFARSGALKKALVRIKNTMDIRKIEDTLPSDPMSYARVLASGVSLRNYEIYYAIKGLNPDVRFSLYEEGICEYYYLAQKNWARILYSYVFFGRFYADDCETLYVYSPEMVKIAWKHIQICQICAVDAVDGLLEKLNCAYGYTETELAGRERACVFLEQQMDAPEAERKQAELIRQIADRVGKDMLVLKLHPRSDANKYGDAYTCMKTRIPFELIAMNENTDHFTFISVGSSALLNFKLMLHKQPDIFVLGMLGDAQKLTEGQLLILRVQESVEKGNFWVPKTNEAFFAQLELLYKQTD